MDKSVNQGAPKIIYVAIVTILAAMYYYAAFIDTPSPENVVENFYQAYFTRDYDTVAENLSVFWAVQFLPQYQSLTPAEMVENRDEIIKDITKVITDIESQNKIPAELGVKVNHEFTREGENSALVAYTFTEKGEASGMEMAVLINEAGVLRIFSFSPTNPEALNAITEDDIKNIDQQFATLLSTGIKEE